MATNKAISPEDRVLRLITIWTWIPAFALLLTYSIIGNDAIPAVGIAPMTFSAVFGLLRVANLSKRRAGNIFLDAFIAVFIFSFMIPSIVFSVRQTQHSWHGELAVVGTFGCSAMMLNGCIHVWFVVRETPLLSLLSRVFCSPTCPHCQRDLRIFGGGSPAQSAHSNSSKESYARVTMLENDDEEPEGRPSSSKAPRPSTDDETARLV